MAIMETNHLQRPWDQLTVQRWQLDRLADGLAQIAKTIEALDGTSDRMRVVSAAGFAAGSASALRMLVESMRKEKP